MADHNDNGNNMAANSPSGKNNSLGLASLVTGIAALLAFSCCGPFSVILGIAAIVTGLLARAEGQDYAVAGIVLGAIAIVIPLLIFFFFAGFTIFDTVIRRIW